MLTIRKRVTYHTTVLKIIPVQNKRLSALETRSGCYQLERTRILYRSLFKTEGLSQSICTCNRPPTKSHQQTTTNILYHVKIHRIQQNNHHRLHAGISKENTSKEIYKDGKDLSIIFIGIGYFKGEMEENGKRMT